MFMNRSIEHDQNLALLGLIEIEDEIVTVEGDKEVIRRTYKLTPKGVEIAEKAFNNLPEYIRGALLKLKRFNEMPLDEYLTTYTQNIQNIKEKGK